MKQKALAGLFVLALMSGAVITLCVLMVGQPTYLHTEPYNGMNIYTQTGTLSLADLLVPSIALIGILIAIIIYLKTPEEEV